MVNLQKIRTIANQKKITIRQLSKDVGITEQGLQSIIRNNTTTTDTLDKISQVLAVPVATFFDETETIISTKKISKAFLAFELDGDQEEKVIKMVMGKEFLKLISI